MATYFTSDFHFDHKKICDFTARPWDIYDQEEALVSRWNQQVEPGDHVYHLGDFSFAGGSKLEHVWHILIRLNGTKHMILGNHDHRNLWLRYIPGRAKEEGRNDIIVLGDYHEMKINKRNITLCHYPMRQWNKKDYGAIMLFGHCHGNLHIEGERTMDVGIDNHPDHRLFSWGEIEERMMAISFPKKNHHNSKNLHEEDPLK